MDEQLGKLSGRGLIVENCDETKKMLFNINYYRFSGYLFGFKQSGSDEYVKGVNVARIKRIYDFDRRFTRILMFALEDIEETLKTRISYLITSFFPDDPLIYLKPMIYRNYGPYIKFLKKFYRSVDDNRKLPFVKHHFDQYGGKMPMWVAVELWTMGNLHAIYDNLLPKYQKDIARSYGTGPTQLSSWIKNLTYTRNHLAHYMRIYDFNFGRSPIQCKNYHVYKNVANRIFDQIYIISFMYSDKNEWNEFVIPEIKGLLYEYAPVISLTCIGFPDNWEELLRK